MLRKNLAIKKRRSWTICELILPVLFGTVTGFISRTLLKSGKTDSDAKDHILDIGHVFFIALIFGTFAFFCTCGFILNEMV